jgi:hypothetical protein
VSDSRNGIRTWLDKAIDTYNYHARKIKENRRWTTRDTAKALVRSLGSISEDIKIAKWCRSHRTKLEEFKYAKDAISWIREKEASLEVDEIDA